MGVDVILLVQCHEPHFTQADLDILGERLRTEVDGIQFYQTKQPLELCPTIAMERGRLRRDRYIRPSDPEWTAPDDAPYHPWLLGKSGEQIIEVGIEERYFGPDYERGRWPLIDATFAWLERAFPGATIWYFGDQGYDVEPMTPGRRVALKRLYDDFIG